MSASKRACIDLCVGEAEAEPEADDAVEREPGGVVKREADDAVEREAEAEEVGE